MYAVAFAKPVLANAFAEVACTRRAGRVFAGEKGLLWQCGRLPMIGALRHSSTSGRAHCWPEEKQKCGTCQRFGKSQQFASKASQSTAYAVCSMMPAYIIIEIF